MFVDELKIQAKAGDGGDGVERWLHLRAQPKGGPAGGNGGKGGDVYVRAVRNVNILSKYTGEKRFEAEDGENGKGRSKYGKNGEDLYIDVPVGSRISDIDRERSVTLSTEGEVQVILKGGAGGLGNEHFKSSTNRAPVETSKGKQGEHGTFLIELMLTADVGLIGFPNAGKSSLLNAFTNATSAIGAYPFTTLEPHLGDLYGFVLADIPGLIEGASQGKGLGHKFLRHVERTSMLLHLISLEQEDAISAYETLRTELREFDQALTEKEEWIVLTKSDLVPEDTAESIREKLAASSTKPVFVISIVEEKGVKELRDALMQHLEGTRLPESPEG